MFQEFKKFVMRGSLLELAVAFILGIAFAAVVTAFTNIVLSLIAAAFGANATFKRLTWVLNGTPIPYGAFLSAVVNFLLVAWVLFLLVKAYNRITGPKGEPAATKACEFCRTAIPVDAERCPNCTSDLMAPSASPPP